MIVNVQNLSKSYMQGLTEVKALNNLTFQMEEGETLAVVGPSGSGKTTLLSLLAGLDDPSSGVIELAGQQITSLNEEQLSEFRAKNMGIVFQQFHLMPYLTAFENVSLPLEIASADDIKEKALAALKSVGLSERIGHRPDQLSGGERQRVAIARALVIEPKILLADEPSGNLDSETGEVIMDLLFELVKKNNMTLILVTHNLDHAQRCKRVIKLKDGTL